MEFAEFLPIIIILFIILLIGVAVVVGIVVIVKTGSFKNGEKEEMKKELESRVETLEREIVDIKNK